MRHAGTNDDVAHAWANSPRDEMLVDGENCDHMNRDNDRSFWFEGYCLYSYRTMIAQRFPKQGFALLSEEQYSPTTGRHLNLAYSAIGNETKAEVPYIDPRCGDDHLANMTKLWNDARSALSRVHGYGDPIQSTRLFFKYVKSFGMTNHLSKNERRVRDLLDGKNEFSANVDYPVSSLVHERPILNNALDTGFLLKAVRYLLGLEQTGSTDGNSILAETLKRYWETEHSQWKAEQDQKEHNKLANSDRWAYTKYRDYPPLRIAELWRSRHPDFEGVNRHYPPSVPQEWNVRRVRQYFGYGRTCYLLRLNEDKTIVETNNGARCSVKEFKVYWRLALLMYVQRFNPIAFNEVVGQLKNSKRLLGSYSVDKVDRLTGMVQLGCHVIPWGEIVRIAQLLELIPPTQEMPWEASSNYLPAPKEESLAAATAN